MVGRREEGADPEEDGLTEPERMRRRLIAAGIDTWRRPKTRDPNTTDEEVALALVESRGNLTAAAEKLRIARTSLYHRVHSNAKLTEIHKTLVESVVDKAEQNVYDAVYLRDPEMTRFLLKTKGRMRGWGEKGEAAEQVEEMRAKAEMRKAMESMSEDELRMLRERILEQTTIDVTPEKS